MITFDSDTMPITLFSGNVEVIVFKYSFFIAMFDDNFNNADLFLLNFSSTGSTYKVGKTYVKEDGILTYYTDKKTSFVLLDQLSTG